MRRFRSHHPQRTAFAYMLISTTAFSAMSVAVRLVADHLSASEIVALRNALTLLLLAPVALRHRGALLRTRRLKAHAWRGAIGAIGMLTWTYALTVMPLTHATALSFVAPMLTTLFAMLYFKEHAGPRRWLALCAGLAGVLLILRPAAEGFDWHALIVIAATTAWATTAMFVKSLSQTEPPLRMVLYMNLFMCLIAAPFGVAHWQTPDLRGWGVLLFTAASSIAMHFAAARAYALAPLVTLMPLDFSRLVITAILAYFLFGETSDWHSWVGAAIILGSAALMARRDLKDAGEVQ